MATLALLNLHLTLNSVDLSDHIRSATITAKAAELSSEAMGDSWEETTGGLKSGQLQVEFLDDFASSSVDATIWAAFNAGTNVTFLVKPVNTTVSATNPSYTGSVHPGDFSVGGAINEIAKKSINWKISGALTRNTT